MVSLLWIDLKCSWLIINKGWWWSHLVVIPYYVYMYICIYTFMTVIVSILVILRSTTGPYGRPIVEVAYGEMLRSLHRGCMEVDSSGRVVGVSTWCRPCWDIPGSTLVWAQCTIFLSFYNIKTYNYVLNLYVL